jgi:hypothetical protein
MKYRLEPSSNLLEPSSKEHIKNCVRLSEVRVVEVLAHLFQRKPKDYFKNFTLHFKREFQK